MAMTTQPHPAPSFKEEYSYTCIAPVSLRGLFWGELYCTLESGSVNLKMEAPCLFETSGKSL